MADRALFELLDDAIDAMLAGVELETIEPEVQGLLGIAGSVRFMPSEDFHSRLEKQLKGKAAMTLTVEEPVREGYRLVTPYLVTTEGDRLIEFLKHTFGAEEIFRSPAGPGFRADLRIGDSMLMIGAWEQVRGQEKTGAFHVYVPDCDAAFQRALEAGGKAMGEPEDRPYGERSGFVKDFAGNTWYIATRFPSVAVPEGTPDLMPYLHPPKARDYIGFLERAFGAEEQFVVEQGGRVMHAAVRIGDAILEMGESEERHPSRLFIYVQDCDAWYRRAVAAGAVPVQQPADQFYGLRTAIVRDSIGNEWEPASLIGQSR